MDWPIIIFITKEESSEKNFIIQHNKSLLYYNDRLKFLCPESLCQNIENTIKSLNYTDFIIKGKDTDLKSLIKIGNIIYHFNMEKKYLKKLIKDIRDFFDNYIINIINREYRYLSLVYSKPTLNLIY